MTISVLHIAHYAASYSGNFIASLEALDNRITQENGKSIYMFPVWAKNNDAQLWIEELRRSGKDIFYFSGNTMKDLLLIRQIVNRYEINVLHTHFLPARYQTAVKMACMGRDIVKIVHFHNHSEEKKGIESYLRKIYYRRSVMVACGESVYKSVCRDYPVNRKYKVDNGITPERLNTYQKISPQELGIVNDNPTCLMFGFDFERKGVDLACLAIQKLWNEGEKVNLVISLSSNFEEVENKIKTLMGEMPEWLKLIPARSDVASLYQSVDVFLSPSREEGLPYSALEACYSSCTLVLSDIEAQKLDIPYTYWFQAENIEALSEAILKALNSKEEKNLHMEEVQSEVMLKYSVSAWAEKMYGIYQKEVG